MCDERYARKVEEEARICFVEAKRVNKLVKTAHDSGEHLHQYDVPGTCGTFNGFSMKVRESAPLCALYGVDTVSFVTWMNTFSDTPSTIIDVGLNIHGKLTDTHPLVHSTVSFERVDELLVWLDEIANARVESASPPPLDDARAVKRA